MVGVFFWSRERSFTDCVGRWRTARYCATYCLCERELSKVINGFWLLKLPRFIGAEARNCICYICVWRLRLRSITCDDGWPLARSVYIYSWCALRGRVLNGIYRIMYIYGDLSALARMCVYYGRRASNESTNEHLQKCVIYEQVAVRN